MAYDRTFQVGDHIDARYAGGQEWYEGTVKNVTVSASYDIQYDDGKLLIYLLDDAERYH